MAPWRSSVFRGLTVLSKSLTQWLVRRPVCALRKCLCTFHPFEKQLSNAGRGLAYVVFPKSVVIAETLLLRVFGVGVRRRPSPHTPHYLCTDLFDSVSTLLLFLIQYCDFSHSV